MPARHHLLHPSPPAVKKAVAEADSSSSRLVPPAPHPPVTPLVVVTARRLAAARARGRGLLMQPRLCQMVQRVVGQMVVVVKGVVRLLRLRPAAW